MAIIPNSPFQNPLKRSKAKRKEKRAQNAEDLKERLAERKQRKEALQEDLENIKNNDPDAPKGLASLKNIIQIEGTKMVEQMIPTITQLAIQMGLEALLNKANEEIPSCPSRPVVEKSLIPLNGLVNDLNATVEKIDKIANIGSFTSDSLKQVQVVANVLNLTIPTISGLAKSTPIIPGVIVSVLDDLDFFRNLILYDNNGSPRLPKLTGQVTAIFAATGLVSSIIRKVFFPIQDIIDKLNKCYPELSDQFPTISDKVKEYAALGENDFEEEEPISYNGFIIEIEEVPFTPTVNRYRAVGYDSYGVPLIKGELSFTPNNSVLVNELKFIIDRDNLSSY